MLRIRDVYPGSVFFPIPDPKKRGEVKFFFVLYLFSYLFVAFRPCWNSSWLITVSHFIIFEKLPFWGVIFFSWRKNFTSKKAIFQIFGHKKRLSQKSEKTTQNKKKCFKLSEVMVGSGIWKKPIPDPGGKKVPDPGSGSATLKISVTSNCNRTVTMKNG